MSYLFKRTVLKDRTILEVKAKNFFIFVILVFLSVIPAAFIVSLYFEDNVNYFRIPYVTLILIIYAILGGRDWTKVFRINKTRKGSLFSFKNQVKYSIPNKK